MDWSLLVIAVVAGTGAFIGAYFAERGKIRAQTAALESIVKQEFAKATAQEAGKQQAITENLHNLDNQMRTLTTTQEQIKAQISGELWYRQTTWNEKRELYGELIGTVFKLSTSYGKLAITLQFGNVPPAPSLIDINVHHSELDRLGALAYIFAGLGCCNALNDYAKGRKIPDNPTEEWALSESRNLNALQVRLVAAAREDLKVVVAAHA
jgi:hypothetical protein